MLGSTGQPRSASRPRHPSRGRRGCHLPGGDAHRHPVAPGEQRPPPGPRLDPRRPANRPPDLQRSGRSVHPGWGGFFTYDKRGGRQPQGEGCPGTTATSISCPLTPSARSTPCEPSRQGGDRQAPPGHRLLRRRPQTLPGAVDDPGALALWHHRSRGPGRPERRPPARPQGTRQRLHRRHLPRCGPWPARFPSHRPQAPTTFVDWVLEKVGAEAEQRSSSRRRYLSWRNSASQKAGRSPGWREVMMMPPASETASTSSWSTQSAPALRRSVLIE
jgi:hypothetical protein